MDIQTAISEELIGKSDVLALAKEMYHPHGNMMIISPEDVEKLKPKNKTINKEK